MYTNAALVQHLTDAKVAEIRRTTQQHGPRTTEARHDVALRIARPLRRWLNH